jgi:hypothetical protein
VIHRDPSYCARNIPCRSLLTVPSASLVYSIQDMVTYVFIREDSSLPALHDFQLHVNIAMTWEAYNKTLSIQ